MSTEYIVTKDNVNKIVKIIRRGRIEEGKRR